MIFGGMAPIEFAHDPLDITELDHEPLKDLPDPAGFIFFDLVNAARDFFSSAADGLTVGAKGRTCTRTASRRR